ncbi:hypothetical protein TNCT_714161 [Trichonephila clavata]|uniref:Uncharacterized protein n=1 Tax=Trichonephila clavata TaxID=2740835 RepID=A0A8X6LQM1_TRICU|nr:hypothetical protein TNCT_714161 [Trichonephila clavata]
MFTLQAVSLNPLLFHRRIGGFMGTNRTMLVRGICGGFSSGSCWTWHFIRREFSIQWPLSNNLRTSKMNVGGICLSTLFTMSRLWCRNSLEWSRNSLRCSRRPSTFP